MEYFVWKGCIGCWFINFFRWLTTVSFAVSFYITQFITLTLGIKILYLSGSAYWWHQWSWHSSRHNNIETDCCASRLYSNVLTEERSKSSSRVVNITSQFFQQAWNWKERIDKRTFSSQRISHGNHAECNYSCHLSGWWALWWAYPEDKPVSFYPHKRRGSSGIRTVRLIGFIYFINPEFGRIFLQ